MNLEQVYEQIAAFAQTRGLEKVVLFGSRARSSEFPKSDIDLAIIGGTGDVDGFIEDVQERLWSLLKIDVVVIDKTTSPDLLSDISRDGKVLYEALR